MVLDIIRPGDKIDIRLLYQNNGKTYKSSVFDFLEDNLMEIAMPTEKGKMVLFNVDVECQLFFYTSKGLYTCDACVEKRYKKNDFFLLGVRLNGRLKKYQQREFFRIDSMVDLVYYSAPKEVLELRTVEEYLHMIESPKYHLEKQVAVTKDISGGGIRFTAKKPLEIGSYILTVIHLSNNKIDKIFYLPGEIVFCESISEEDTQENWLIRVKWIFHDLKDRDLIVKFVFEEDRAKRKKESGW